MQCDSGKDEIKSNDTILRDFNVKRYIIFTIEKRNEIDSYRVIEQRYRYWLVSLTNWLLNSCCPTSSFCILDQLLLFSSSTSICTLRENSNTWCSSTLVLLAVKVWLWVGLVVLTKICLLSQIMLELELKSSLFSLIMVTNVTIFLWDI